MINNDGTWSIVDGTSAATVFVTGAIALLLEANPSLAANESSGSSDTVVQIKQALMDSSKPLPSQDGHDDNTVMECCRWKTCLQHCLVIFKKCNNCSFKNRNKSNIVFNL